MITVARLRGSLMVLASGLLLAACSSGSSPTSTPSPTTGGASTTGGAAPQTSATPAAQSSSGSGQVVFNVTVNFTGDDNIQGSFVDNDTGSGYTSCNEYATFNPTVVGTWASPGPPAGADTQIGGKSVDFLIGVSTNDFHGPATYANSFANLTIGADTFIRGNSGTSSMTLNADGSGQGTFSDYEDIGAASGTESGTVSWTCSN